MKIKRDLINTAHVNGAENLFSREITEKPDLILHFLGQLAIGAAEQHIGLNSDFAQLLNTVLSRFCLELPCSRNIGNQG